jgi:2-dehydropantoate 2-reductase
VKICILGAGSLGSAIGGHLARAGNEVVLVNRNAGFCDAVNSRGLTLVIDGKEEQIPLRACQAAGGLEAMDLVIVLVKSKDTASVMQSAIHLVGPETVVMSLQNGLGQEKILAEIVGREHLLAGKTYVGGLMIAPGKVVAGAAGKETLVGELEGPVTPRVRRIVDTFNAAGLPAVARDDMMAAIWDKLFVNVATGAVAAVTGLDYGNLYDIDEIRETGIAAVVEAMQVADALGIPITTREPAQAWEKASAGLPFGFKTSMLQSLEKGSVTEVDFINGSVVRAGDAAGIATPVNRTLVAMVKGVERALDPKPVPASEAAPRIGATRAYVEHVAVNVNDIGWHLRFFREVLGMTLTMTDGDEGNPAQAWTLGGMQLVSRPGHQAAPGTLNHIGVAVCDAAAAIEAARKMGVKSDPRGEHWLALPDSIVVELLEASPKRVEGALKLDPRAK